LELEYYDLSRDRETEKEVKKIIKGFVRPFDLERAPLMRTGLIKTGGPGSVLIVDIHHIITDAISMDILKRDFRALYEGEDLPPLRIQYKEFTLWQRDLMRSGEMKAREEYWLKIFEGDILALDLPADFERPAVRGIEGSAVFFELGEERTAALKNLAFELDATLFMVLTGLLYVLLSNLSRQEDIVVGIPVAGRRHTDLDQVIGFLVGTLALRCYPRGDKTFREFLAEVKEKTLSAYENQDYQLDDLVAKLGIPRDPGRNPLFDVMFVFRENGAETETRGTHTSETYEFENKIARYDLGFAGKEENGNISFMCEYSTALFKEERIERFFVYLAEIVDAVTTNIDVKLENIEISHDLYDRKLVMPQTDFAF